MFRPSPGWMRLPTTRPIASANVVMTMKYSSASPPILPTVAAFAIEPTPTTIVQKMIGAIIILISATKPLPIGSSADADLGPDQPDRRAEHDGDDHRHVQPGVLVPGRLARAPVVAGELERFGSGDLKSHRRLQVSELRCSRAAGPGIRPAMYCGAADCRSARLWSYWSTIDARRRMAARRGRARHPACSSRSRRRSWSSPSLLVLLLAFEAQATERAEAETRDAARVARTIAAMPEVAAAVTSGSDADATAQLQPIADADHG